MGSTGSTHPAPASWPLGPTGAAMGGLLPWAKPKSFAKLLIEICKVLLALAPQKLGDAKALLHGLVSQLTALGGSSDMRPRERGCDRGV